MTYQKYNLKKSRKDWDSRGKAEYDKERRLFGGTWPNWSNLTSEARDFYLALAQVKAQTLTKVKKSKK